MQFCLCLCMLPELVLLDLPLYWCIYVIMMSHSGSTTNVYYYILIIINYLHLEYYFQREGASIQVTALSHSSSQLGNSREIT